MTPAFADGRCWKEEEERKKEELEGEENEEEEERRKRSRSQGTLCQAGQADQADAAGDG